MRLIDVDPFEVVSTNVPEGFDPESYMAGMNYILEKIDKQPTVDAEPVRHGRWVKKMYTYYCSECMTIGSPQWKRCPVCETKMEV